MAWTVIDELNYRLAEIAAREADAAVTWNTAAINAYVGSAPERVSWSGGTPEQGIAVVATAL